MFRKFPNGEQTQLHVSADVTIDFNQEKLQIFDECWRELRDRFYDPTFRGLDWSAAHAQLRRWPPARRLPAISIRSSTSWSVSCAPRTWVPAGGIGRFKM